MSLAIQSRSLKTAMCVALFVTSFAGLVHSAGCRRSHRARTVGRSLHPRPARFPRLVTWASAGLRRDLACSRTASPRCNSLDASSRLHGAPPP
jgi:hypothetical protein